MPLISAIFDRANLRLKVLVILIATVLAACSPLISDFNLEAYKSATGLKARSLQIVELSGEPYAKHETRVLQLQADLNGAYEFARGRAKNTESAAQWREIVDPEGHLVGGYLVRWKHAGNRRMSAFFITEAKAQIGQAFDYVICLEANKRISASCTNPVIFEQQ